MGVALGACGPKFVADQSEGAGAGSSSAGANSGGYAGRATGRGGDANDAGADSSAGEAGSDSGGLGGSSGTGGSGAPGGGGGSGAGGSGAGGSGGALIDPGLPPSGLLLWLRADLGVQSKDGLVQTWLDQSGNQTNATGSGAARPSYLAKGFNGRPTLEFDGEGQFLSFEYGFANFSKGLAGFIVAKPTKSDCAAMVEFSSGSEIDDISLGLWEDRWLYEVETPYISSGKVDLGRFSLYAVNHLTSGSADLRIDGRVLSTLSMSLPPMPKSESGLRENNFVGHTLYGNCNYFEGQISEIILYSRTLAKSEIGAIEKYLSTHWALDAQDTPAPAP